MHNSTVQAQFCLCMWSLFEAYYVLCVMSISEICYSIFGVVDTWTENRKCFSCKWYVFEYMYMYTCYNVQVCAAHVRANICNVCALKCILIFLCDELILILWYFSAELYQICIWVFVIAFVFKINFSNVAMFCFI